MSEAFGRLAGSAAISLWKAVMISGGTFQSPFLPFLGGGAPSGWRPSGSCLPRTSTYHLFLDARYQGLKGRMSKLSRNLATGKPESLLFPGPPATSGGPGGCPAQFPALILGRKDKSRRNWLSRRLLRCRGERI